MLILDLIILISFMSLLLAAILISLNRESVVPSHKGFRDD